LPKPFALPVSRRPSKPRMAAPCVRVPPHDPRRDPDTLLLNPSAIRDFSQRLADSLDDVLDSGRFPVVLGGDCNILIGDMLALRRRGRYGLFFLDGHADFYQPEASPTGAVSDMDLAIVTGYGPAELSDIEGRRPLVREEDVVVFGYRDAEEAAQYCSQDVRDTTMHVYDLSAVQALGAEDAAAQGIDVSLGMARSLVSGSTSTPTFSTMPLCQPWTTACPAGSALPSSA
jgi:arginase